MSDSYSNGFSDGYSSAYDAANEGDIRSENEKLSKLLNFAHTILENLGARHDELAMENARLVLVNGNLSADLEWQKREMERLKQISGESAK